MNLRLRMVLPRLVARDGEVDAHRGHVLLNDDVVRHPRRDIDAEAVAGGAGSVVDAQAAVAGALQDEQVVVIIEIIAAQTGGDAGDA